MLISTAIYHRALILDSIFYNSQHNGGVVLVGFRPYWKTNWLTLVLWHCWFGHMTCKNRPRYDL